MGMTSLGDLAQGLVLRTRSALLKREIATLTEALSSGVTGDLAGRLGGDVSYLAGIDRDLRRLEGFRLASEEAALFAGTAQTHLGRLQGMAADLGADLIRIGPSSPGVSRAHAVVQARAGLDTALAALNGSIGGRHLFGGTATDRPPLGSADTILDGLRGAVAGLATAAEIEAAATAWFDDPAGFRAAVYAGSEIDLAAMRVGSDAEVSLRLRADDPTFRDILRPVALAALAGDPALDLAQAAQETLLHDAGVALMTGQDRLAGLGADLGFAEARIAEVSARNAAARTGLELARNTITAADPYDTASRLQEVQFQLESLYSVTVRSSRLSLLSFLE